MAPWNGVYVELFNLLSEGRPSGPNGPLPIPLSDLATGLALFDLNAPDERLEGAKIIRAMDSVWLELSRQKIEQEIEKAKAMGELEGRRRARRR